MRSVLFIQPIEIGADGRENMCDGCSDMTVHDGKVVWCCLGGPLRAVRVEEVPLVPMA